MKPTPEPLEPTELKWYAVMDDLIGGWAVSTVNKPTSQLVNDKPGLAELEVACFIDEDSARHVVDLHNKWLARKRKKEATSA